MLVGKRAHTCHSRTGRSNLWYQRSGEWPPLPKVSDQSGGSKGLCGADKVLFFDVRIGHKRWIQFVKIY